jgi:hypothetical protein
LTDGPGEVVEVPRAALVVGPLGETATVVFVYRKDDPIEFALQVTLQEMFLCHLKVRNVERNLRAYHLRQAKEQDFRLRQLIADSNPHELGLRDLQTANDRLTTLRADLVTSICAIENELRTMQVARDNFAAALQGSDFEADAGRLTRTFIDRLAVPLRNQALVDVGYRQATRDRATVHFESLDATIDLHDAKQTQILAIVMAALTCAQVAGLIPTVAGNDYSGWYWWWRLVTVVGGTGILFVLSWFLIRRR